VQQHPELAQLVAAERVSASWSILIAEAAAHPGLVVLGFLKSGLGLFASPFGMFSYVWTNPDDAALEDGAAVRAATAQDGLFGPLLLWQRTFGTYSLFNAAAMGLIGGAFLLGFLWSLYVLFVKERTNPRLSLLRYAIGGIILSAPFTPPWITSGQQVATCTLSFMGALPGIALFRRGAQTAPDEHDEGERTRRIDPLVYVPAGVALALALVVGWIRLATPYKPVCTNPAEHVLLPLSAASVEVTNARDMVFRDKAIDDLRFSIRYLAKHNAELTDSVVPFLHAGTEYVSAFDACDSRVKILVDDAHRLDGASSWASYDVTPLASPNVLHLAGAR